MEKIRSDFVVYYVESFQWVNHILIFMELCETDLKHFIQKKEIAFKMNEKSTLNPIDYFISTELLIEIIESVNYLHSLKPPIIHRDLKPQNILLKVNGIKGRLLRICDFGLISLQNESMKHEVGVGTHGYIAPEIFHGKYDTKVDIFSTGNIAAELFYPDLYYKLQLIYY